MSPRLRFWVIADDLTGALDTAAPFAARAWRTCVVPWPGRGPGAIATALRAAAKAHDVVVIDTASRHVAAREAARRVRDVVAAARRSDPRGAPARGFYKKIDSTLRGNVAAELAAFRAATGVACLPLAPAFPAQGRTTRDGAVWVDGRPLSTSAAAHDALAPAVSGELARLGPPGALDVCDAHSDADLRRVATRLDREGRLGAVVGSGGLAGAIAARFGAPPRATRRLVSGRPVLVVSGSAHPSAQVQARALVAAGALGLVAPIDPRTPLRDRHATETLAISALQSGRPVVLASPALAAGARITAPRAAAVAARLAAVARTIVTAGPVGAVFTVGGDTTAAVVAAMGWAPLAVDGALVPGVAVVRLAARRAGSNGPAWLITKSGAFGDPQTLRRLVRRLTSSSRSGRPATLR
ncbi:MAG: four-carbon acid sugar kinase family protein [Vicinamibacteraceae bacterium]